MNLESNRDALLKEVPVKEQVGERPSDKNGQKRILAHTDERDLKTSYANACRATATAEEILLDFGLNHVQLPGHKDGETRMVFHTDRRIIMNYYSAKRLTMALSQIIRRHEQEFGELELNAAKRRSGPDSN